MRSSNARKEEAPSDPLDDRDIWVEFTKGVNECPMYDLFALAAKGGFDPHRALAKLQTYYHTSRATH